MEIERKFLVKIIPKNINEYPKFNIEQGYLSFNPEVRIRNKNEKYYLTVKGNGTIAREEYETKISKMVYVELKNKVQGLLLKKERFNIPLNNGLMAELDLYKNLDGLNAMVEVEFQTIELANNFYIPEWFGKEVTNDESFKNKNLIKIRQ